MASEGGGKLKQKRNQSQSKPYERKSSLFGKLKDSVKDLLIPSWLSGSSSAKREGDGHASTSHAPTSHAPNVEVRRQGGIVGPPAPDWSQRNSFPSDRLAPNPMTIAYGNASSAKLTASHIPGFGLQAPNGDLPIDQSTSSCGAPAPNQTIGPHIQPVLSFSGRTDPVPSNNPDLTRGQDSMCGRRPGPFEKLHSQEIEATPIRPIMVSTGVKSTSAKQDVKRQRLWSPEPMRQGKPLVPPVRGKPSFNSLLFGTPSKGDATLNNSGFGDSSFYVGKTCYGGASSSKRKALNTSLPYHSSLPLRKQVKASTFNRSLNATTSSTAQRILDTLERMSTPLEDARKIPQTPGEQSNQSNDSVLSFTPSSYRRQSSQCSVRPVTRPLQLPNRGSQGTPHMDTPRNRDRSRSEKQGNDSVLSITQEAVSTKESAVGSSTPSLPSFGAKMKSQKKFSQHIGALRRDEEETIVVPNLRTDFTLPLSGMTPINFQSGSAKSHPYQASASLSAKSSGVSTSNFTFSTPIVEKNGPSGSQLGALSEKGFKFSSPIPVSATKTSAAGAEEGSKFTEPGIGAATPPVSMWAPQMVKPKAMSPDIGGTSSSFQSYNKWSGSPKNDVANGPPSVGLPVAKTLKKGSVMDILGGAKSSLSSSQAEASSKTSNASPFSSDSGKSQVPLSALFQQPAGSWECGTCMIQNTASVNKCVACETVKPGSKPSAKPGAGVQAKPLSTATKPGSNTGTAGASMGSSNIPLSELFKKPEGSWECDTCMIQNSSAVVKCVACETPKPGAKIVNKSNNSLAAMFKKPEGSWECDTCMVQNTSTALRCIACDSSKPGLQSAGIVSKPPPSSSTNSDIQISPSGGFSFNVMPSTTTTTTGSAGFKFGNTSASVINSTATQNSGGFSFGQNLQKGASSVNSNKNVTGGFQFGTMPPSGASVSASPSGGFQFGAAVSSSAVSTASGGLSSGTSVSSISSGGFQFGATAAVSSNAVSVGNGGFTSGASVAVPSGVFQFGAPQTSSSVNDSSQKSVGPSSQSSLSSTSSSTPVVSFTLPDNNNKSSTAPLAGGFQFGSTAISVPVAATTAPVDKKTSAPSQASFTFGATQAPVGQANPFVFGAPVSSAPSSGGLGMGGSLAAPSQPAAPIVNGGFGMGMDKKNDFNAGTGGFVFGGKQPSNAMSSQNTTKRSIDGAELGAPSAKINPVFSSGTKVHTVNGGFNYGGQSAFPSTGSMNASTFNFGSTSQPSQPGAFQFSAGTPASQPPPAAPGGGFAFGAKPQAGQNALPAKKSEVSFGVNPSFNFAAPPTDGNAVFQFGGKAPDAASSIMFAFGGPSNSTMPQPSVPAFGGSAGAPAVGSFNIGSSVDTSQRKMKKAVRRIKPGGPR